MNNVSQIACVNPTQLQEQADAYRWHHSIDLGNGVVTKGGASLDLTNAIAASLFDGIDLSGKHLLDIGAWNGAYSFEAKRRGCARVLASDKFCWTHPDIKGRETFDLAMSALNMDIETKEIDVPDISPESIGMFDCVLFSGVFYHLINPVHLTRQISACAKHLIILETHQDLIDYPRPGMVFYPGDTLAGDETNWWGPNPQAVFEILKEIGFTRVFYQDSPQYDDVNSSLFRRRGTYYAFRNEESVEYFKAGHQNWMDLGISSVRDSLFAALESPETSNFLQRENIALKVELENLTAKIETMVGETKAAHDIHIQKLQDGHRDQINALKNSTSWRITAPLRWVKSMLS